MSRIAVLDLETTGDNPDAGDVPVEGAIVFLKDGQYDYLWHSLIDPGTQPINPIAAASHHITRAQAKMGIRVRKGFWAAMLDDCDYIAAHVAAFDRQFLPNLRQPWICTYRCALHLFPTAPKHSLQVLRYYLDLQPKIPLNLHPHRALYDAQCCASLVQEMLKMCTAEELLNLTTAPLVLRQVRFGKHRGEDWDKLPMDYLHWILRQDFDEDTKHTARHYIEETRRREPPVSEVPESVEGS